MATTPNPPTPPTTPTTPTPPKSNIVWWIAGILLAAVCVFAVGGVLLATYIARRMNVEVTATGPNVEISTPVGTLRASKDARTDPGLPIYPGAKVTQAAGSVELSAGEAEEQEESVAIIAAQYVTTDPISKVDEWYGAQLGSEFTREGPGVYKRKKNILGIRVSSDDVAYVSEKNDVLRVVAIKRQFNGVEVALVRIGKKEDEAQ